jgi:K+-transporting ATPase KdpF subunit
LAAGDVSLGHYSDGTVLPVHGSLRENIEDEVIPMMIYLTAVVAVFLFVYLVMALVRPEWF